MDYRKIYEKYKDVLPYLFFGVCTTLVNVIVYWIFAYPFRQSVMVSTIVAWVFAVLFAYITNRKWVFYSEASGGREVLIEMAKFFLARLATGGVDWICMFVFVNLLGLNDLIIKFLANVLVIILNYIASKLIIFKKRK